LHLQGPTVEGEVSLTCDAWQASNTDGFFAVTAHWIKKSAATKWELKSALIGFTRLNNAHHGVRLGQALFKIIKRVGIEYKVSLCVPLPALALTPVCPRASTYPYLHSRPPSLLGPPSPLPSLLRRLLVATMKVGHVTCDNASNNSTMMKEFAARLKITTGNKYDWKKRKIKFVCLLYVADFHYS
jgi:hypothetical protein